MSDNLYERFVLNCDDLVYGMKNTNHYCDAIPNPYHLENDVWTHTTMVYSNADNYLGNLGLALKLTALFHDIGKIYTRELSKKHNDRVHFFGHPGSSALRSLEFFDRLGITDKSTIALTHFLISNHHEYMDILSDPRPSRVKDMYNRCGEYYTAKTLLNQMINDANGRITSENNHIFEGDILDELELCRMPFEKEGTYDYYADERPELVVMIGLPCSGKSNASITETRTADYHRVSRDDIVMELGGKSGYNECWDSVDHKQVDRIYNKRLIDAMRSFEDVLVDETNLSRKSRRRFKQFRNYKKRAVVLMTSFDECLRRNTERTVRENKHIPLEVYLRMEKSYMTPGYDEFDMIDYLFPDGEVV